MLRHGVNRSRHRFRVVRILVLPRSRYQQPFLHTVHSDVGDFMFPAACVSEASIWPRPMQTRDSGFQIQDVRQDASDSAGLCRDGSGERRTYTATSLAREVNPAAFFQLRVDRAKLFVGESARSADDQTGKAFGIEDGDGALALGFDPPSRKDENRID